MTLHMASGLSTDVDTDDAVSAVIARIEQALGGAPDLILFQTTEHHDPEAISRTLRGHRAYGATSCHGVMTDQGFAGGHAFGALGFRDDDGAYGVGQANLGTDPRAASAKALEAALADAKRPGELPAWVWLGAAPGHEEAVLAGIADVIGSRVPVIGGSSADDNVAGAWFQAGPAGVTRNGVGLAVGFPSAASGHAFHSGYAPTGIVGTVTAAEGRVLQRVDGMAAATWYDTHTGTLSGRTGTVLSDTTLWPLGRVTQRVGTVDLHLLSHPEAVLEDGALRLFTEVSVGDQLCLMNGTIDALVDRGRRTAVAARGELPADIIGAVGVYCAGCMLTIGDRIEDVAREMAQSLDGKPFLGGFTFGEQGAFPGDDPHHGNLMVSVLALGR